MQNNENASKSFRQLMKERGFYIVLILCVAAVGVSGYFFVRSTQTANGDEPTLTLSEQKDPAGSNSTTEQPGTDTAETLNPTLDPEEQIRETAQSVTVWPLKGEILNTFSADALVFNETMQDWRVHEGIDIAASAGATVSAAQAGTVSAVYDDDFLGTVVIVDSTQEGIQMVYANLTEMPTVAAGDTVSAGQTIGAVGGTALLEVGSEPHLHFEVLKNGDPVNPVDYLPAS